MCTQLPPRPELCQVSEDFPDHWVQPKVHLSALHICLCSAVGTEVCAISSVVLSWSLSLGKVGLNERRKNLKRELRGRWTSGRLKTCALPKAHSPFPSNPTLPQCGTTDLLISVMGKYRQTDSGQEVKESFPEEVTVVLRLEK